MSERHFSIATLLRWIVVAALLCGLVCTQSPISLFVSSAGLSLVAAASYYRRTRNLCWSGALFGLLLPSYLWFALIAYFIRTAPVYNGQLYHEDGPAIFFFLVAIFACVTGAVGAILGASMTTIWKWFIIALTEPLSPDRP